MATLCWLCGIGFVGLIALVMYCCAVVAGDTDEEMGLK